MLACIYKLKFFEWFVYLDNKNGTHQKLKKEYITNYIKQIKSGIYILNLSLKIFKILIKHY